MKQMLVCLVAVLAFTGCPMTLYPIYDDDSVIFDEALAGTWRDTDDAIWEFSRKSDDSMTYTWRYSPNTDEDPYTYVFDVHLTKIGDTRFLDVFPDHMEDKAGCCVDNFYSEDYLFKLHFYPVHSFFLVRELGDTLVLSRMDHEWFKHYMKKPRWFGVKGRLVDDWWLLTSPTAKLRRFLKKAAGSEDAFYEGVALERVKAESIAP